MKKIKYFYKKIDKKRIFSYFYGKKHLKLNFYLIFDKYKSIIDTIDVSFNGLSIDYGNTYYKFDENAL